MEGADGFRGYVTADCSALTYGSEGLATFAGSRILEEGGTEAGLTAEPGTNIRVAIDNICTGRFISGRVDPIGFARDAFARQP